MIRIDFSSAISAYLCFSIFLVFILWVFYNQRKGDITNETKYLQQCPYCTYMFFNYSSEGSTKARGSKDSESTSKTKEPALIDALGGANPNSQKSKAIVCPRCSSYIDI